MLTSEARTRLRPCLTSMHICEFWLMNLTALTRALHELSNAVQNIANDQVWTHVPCSTATCMRHGHRPHMNAHQICALEWITLLLGPAQPACFPELGAVPIIQSACAHGPLCSCKHHTGASCTRATQPCLPAHFPHPFCLFRPLPVAWPPPCGPGDARMAGCELPSPRLAARASRSAVCCAVRC